MRKDVAVPSVVEDIQFKVVKGASEAFAPKSAEMEYAAALVSEVVALETPHHRLLLVLSGLAVLVMSLASGSTTSEPLMPTLSLCRWMSTLLASYWLRKR